MYILRNYMIEEYEIDAKTRKEAIEKFEKGDYEETSVWLEKYTIRKAPAPQG